MAGVEHAEALSAALPSTASVTTPSMDAPSLNVTVPVAVPLPGETAATVAVKVTDWPKTDGLAELVNAVVVFVLALTTIPVAISVRLTGGGGVTRSSVRAERERS